MKFGKYLATRQLELPEYADDFINYKQLKKLINRLAGQDQKAAHEKLQQNKASFFFQLERELEKVQTCYQRKENDLEARLTTLSNKLNTVKSGIGNPSSDYIGLYESVSRFRGDLERLEEFVELNGTGFSKVLKKWDKRSHLHTKELFLRRAVEIQPMFNRDILGELSDSANKLFLELEAANSGDTVFAPSSLKASNVALNPSDDIVSEFVTFASQPNTQERVILGQLSEWKQRLLHSVPPQLSRAFRALVASTASDKITMTLFDPAQIDIQEVDEYSGKSCLHYAASCREGRIPIVDLCLEHKIPVDFQDHYGKTALHYATISKRADIVKKLLAADASGDILDVDNYSPLHYSLFFNIKSIFKLLLDSGARVTGNSERDYLPLNFACQYAANDCIEVYLQQYPHPEMVADAEGLYPLHIVARSGHYQLVKPLVDAGANINGLDKLNEWTPLMYASTAGNSETVTALLECGADWTILDERGYSALFYACWQGHSRSIYLLKNCLPPNTTDISRATNYSSGPTISVAADMSDDMNFDLDEDDLLDLDGIPALSLPPPIIPIQRYGHSFLDSQKVILQIMFDRGKDSISFKDDRRLLSAGRMTISTSSSRDSITRNIELPVREDQKVQLFQVEDLEKFSIDFDVLPTFGTRVMVKATALSVLFDPKHDKEITLPLLNALLRASGTLQFSYLVVMPYPGKPLEITKFETYWKSTSYIESTAIAYPRDHYHATHTVESAQVQSFSVVTSTSLQGRYSRVPVTLSSDGVVLVCNASSQIQGVEIPISSLRAYDVTKLFPEIKTLEEYLETTDDHQIDIYVPYPTKNEINSPLCPMHTAIGLNECADGILKVVFDHVRRSVDEKKVAPKKFLFTSPNANICTVINWKQANYPVIFVMNGLSQDGRYLSANRVYTDLTSDGLNPVSYSCKEAARFASQNNLMGVALPGFVLKLAPAIVQAVRVLGLVVIADGAESINGVDGSSNGNIMEFAAK